METVKMGFKVPRSLNDELNDLIPAGLKTRIIIAALNLIAYDIKAHGKLALAEWLNLDSPGLAKKLTQERSNLDHQGAPHHG